MGKRDKVDVVIQDAAVYFTKACQKAKLAPLEGMEAIAAIVQVIRHHVVSGGCSVEELKAAVENGANRADMEIARQTGRVQ